MVEVVLDPMEASVHRMRAVFGSSIGPRVLTWISLVSLLGCGGTARQPSLVAETAPPPGLCEQIEAYVNAYIGYVGCVQPNLGGGFGYFATIAEQEASGINCTPANSVQDLPYHSARVDEATRAVMREQLQGELGLYGGIQAISWASLSIITPVHGDESIRRRAEEELRSQVRKVPALYNSLVSEIAERLGAAEPCAVDLGKPTIAESSLPPILEALARTEDRDGCVKRGLMNFPAGQNIDPNIAVAIARLQHGNLSYVPTLAQLEATLRAMDIELQTDSAGK